ncbi:MAG: hypothetical protein ACYDCJ_12530 [Gammaproteobacteria bacterium]
MPQNPLGPRPGGNATALNLTAATVVKASPGTVYRVNVNTAGSTVGGIYDAATLAGNVAANLILPLEAAGTFDLTFPCAVGILFEPGTGMVCSISYA